ncbi:MAG: LamG-like jellyroll fold domain-containing protein, partial [Chitinophagales bacterium]
FIDGALVNTGNVNMYSNFEAGGSLFVGKNTATDATFFNGNIHEVRVWSTYRTDSDIVIDMNQELSRSDIGLLYNWKMDEATDIFVIDQVRRRDGVLDGATWQVNPNGNAVTFDGVDDFVEIDSIAEVVITDEMDFTLEFWFNSTTTDVATLFSNGNGDGLGADSLFAWNIEKDAAGQIHVKHYGMDFVAVNDDYFDGEWHHFALILNRTGNLSAYINGDLQNSMQVTADIAQFGSTKLFLGSRGYFTGITQNNDQFFDGQIDEFRFWNTARKIEQVARDKQNRLLGDELGLQVYLPFEEYQEVSGVPILNPSFVDAAAGFHQVNEVGGATLGNTTPTIKIQRTVQGVNFAFSVNNDEIIITPTSPAELIENVTLDITVDDIQDLNGNEMQSPKTWIAYIDKNQVVWQDDVLTFDKAFGDELIFTTNIVNTGGEAKVYDISNLPSWLIADHTTGSIAPNSVKEVVFTISTGTNIGDYTQDIHLMTDFGFPEKLTIELAVRDEAPDWTVNPNDFEYSMNIIGYLQIEGIVSTDEEDVLGVFVDNEPRGSVNLQYIAPLDRYIAFLDVYSHTTAADSLRFKIWDASKGNVYIDVIPSLEFVVDATIGSLLSPQLFSAGNGVVQEIPLQTGWNWIGYNLLSEDSANLDVLMESVAFSAGDQLKHLTEFADYSGASWNGEPFTTVGVSPEKGYRLRVSNDDTLSLYGSVIDPTTRTISLVENWNWIGFISIRNQSVDEALGNLNATTGDLIKGKSQFAIYDDNLGWIGSLNTLIPGQSYMYHSASIIDFTFPYAGAFKSITQNNDEIIDERWTVDNAKYPTNMTHIVSLNACEAIDNSFEIEDWYVGVFDKNETCRGISSFENLNETLIAYITIGGNSQEKLEYRLLNKETSKEYTAINQLVYQSNAMKGNINDPYMIELSDIDCKKLSTEENVYEEEGLKVYPTLFDNTINVEYSVSQDSKITIRLFNSLGQIVFAKDYETIEGNNRILVDLKENGLAHGAYYFELKDQTNQDVKYIKVIHL